MTSPPRGASLPPPQPPAKPSSPIYTTSSHAGTAAPSPASTPSRSQTPVRTPAPYLPGFQPRGVIRPLTDDFLEARRARRDAGRVERTRLERRLEKLINLHFGTDAEKHAVEKPRQRKRMSSIFDFDIKDLRNLDAGDLWRGVMQSQVAPGSKADIRAAEQNITPWEDDAAVSQCPLCTYVPTREDVDFI
ncbi:hypothetical protein EWM64_g770 [Hericium alpestre]|uniref:Uncharacterized protein n=1 Tax=Hericium alpestre TaxID=135208 RepID=A0A4Z0AAG1_9AGAM|nr:hypothetical protein EWM64_g770 [Hericium alpestre]